MTKSSSHHSAGQKPQIVPKSYWTFWFVLSLFSAVGAFFMAVLWWPDRQAIVGVVSVCWAIAWTVVYWKIRHGAKYPLLGVVGFCVAFFTGCVSKNVGSTLAEAMVNQAIAPPIELSLSVSKFRQATQRWPRNYEELSAFSKQSGDGVQLRHYDRIDFIENSDGSLEVYTAAAGLTNRMTLTATETDPK